VLHGDNMKHDCDNIVIICGMYNDEVYDIINSKQLFKEVVRWG